MMPPQCSRNLLLVGILLAVILVPAISVGQTVDEDLWVTTHQNEVRAVARDGNTIYIGGTFTFVGPPNGKAVTVDASSGTVTTAPKPNAASLISGTHPDAARMSHSGRSAERT